jgi:hypothetical protein
MDYLSPIIGGLSDRRTWYAESTYLSELNQEGLMTGRADFERDEWLLLGDVPLAASAAVAVASPGGGGREASALLLAWRSADAVFADSPLIQAIVDELDPEDREQQEQAAQAATEPPSVFANVLDEAIDLCRRAVALLQAKATQQEVADYGAFVLHIARQVAEATREGGFLGLGGEAVSRAERAVLNELALALGVESADE